MIDLVEKLQKQSYETRVKILWTTAIVIGIILCSLWIFGFKSNIKNLDATNIIKTTASGTQTQFTNTTFATMERIEVLTNSLKLYFNFNNTTDDILNISKLPDITLNIDGQQINPTQIIDRQGQIFVQKILSHTQNFGILIFPSTNAKSGTLTFNQMYFEQNPSDIFAQKLELDLNKLKTANNLRN